jgi:hypothetical protein
MPIYYTPKSYTEILQSKYSTFVLPKETTKITNYSRYLIKIGTLSTNFLGISSTSSLTIYNCTLNVLKKSITYSQLLGSTFQLVQNIFDKNNNNLYYRIDSDLHSNFSLDCSFNSIGNYSSNLYFVNNWGIDRSDLSYNENVTSDYTFGSGATGSSGYIVFIYDSKNKKLTAKARYYVNNTYYINTGNTDPGIDFSIYNAGGGGEGHILDTCFNLVGYNLYYNNGNFSLVSPQSTYSKITLYESPINLSIPSQFNPNNISRQLNLATSLYVKGAQESGLTALYNVNQILHNIYGSPVNPNLSPAGYNYYNQLYTYNSTNMTITNQSNADISVNSMLSTIFSSNSNKSSIRYPISFYQTLRTGLLKNSTASNSIMNAYLTGKTVLQVYFTNENDSYGNPAPFMVILNTSTPSGPCRFLNVNKPPGDAINHNYEDTSTNTYVNQYVTRTASYQTFLTKIPMLNYGYAGTIEDTSGNLNQSVMSEIGTLASENNKTNYDYFNYVSRSSCGIAIDSTQLYPVLNNALVPSCIAAELTALGHHSGQGLGLHYHADSFQCGLTNVNLYNIPDYIKQSHPPLIGIGFDGIALYGSYSYGYDAKKKKFTYKYSNMKGYATSLDSYGGHSHDDYGYHYHATPLSSQSIPCYKSQSGSGTYSVYALMYGSWAGLVTSIPYFSDLDAPNQQTKYVGLMSPG